MLLALVLPSGSAGIRARGTEGDGADDLRMLWRWAYGLITQDSPKHILGPKGFDQEKLFALVGDVPVSQRKGPCLDGLGTLENQLGERIMNVEASERQLLCQGRRIAPRPPCSKRAQA